KKLWAADIENELRQLEDYVIDLSPTMDLGKNLIADALGPEAAYTHFHPNPGTMQPRLDHPHPIRSTRKPDERTAPTDYKGHVHRADTALRRQHAPPRE